MSDVMKQIIEETGSINVESITYTGTFWVVTYKSGLQKDEFESFADLFDFLQNEGND